MVCFALTVVGLDIQDDMGRHEVGFVENVEKYPSSEGTSCRFKAKFKVNKVCKQLFGFRLLFIVI